VEDGTVTATVVAIAIAIGAGGASGLGLSEEARRGRATCHAAFWGKTRLMREEELFEKTVLPSGLTVVTETMPDRRSVSVGAWLRNGARDEPGDLLGVSHFIEHMMFKGTERRDARAIAQSLESLGGHLDAFTGREQVCYYARALAEHLPQVVDVLSDIVCRSRFAETDVTRERSVVREEIFACEDNPEDKVNELMSGDVWGGHALGCPILGTVDTIDRLDPQALKGYFRSRYRPEHLVVAAAGGLEHRDLIALVTDHFLPPDGDPMPLSAPPPPFRPSVRHEIKAELQQLYLSLGTRAIAYADPDRYALIVLNTLLGGGMSSRLFQGVREEAGLAYSIYSAADFHRDAGMLTIQLGVSPERGREALARVREELVALVERGPDASEIEAARSQIKGSILIGQESVSSRMYTIAHEEIYCGRFTSPAEQVQAIDQVRGEDVNRLARRFLDPGRFAITALGPAVGGPIDERDWPLERSVEAAA
jgi:predicted Zn-dependent peptidase